MTRTVDTPPTDTKRRLPRPAWAALGTVAALAADAVTERYDPALGMIMFVCDAGFPVVLALVLVLVILFGGEDRKDRAFRLLRWVRDEPDPPGPPQETGAAGPGERTRRRGQGNARSALAVVGLLRGDQRRDDAPGDSDAAAELAEPRRGADDDPEPAGAVSRPPAATSTPESSSRHSSANASGAAMPTSAATTGRAAASLRAAIALSAQVSVSTIHHRQRPTYRW